MSEPTAEQQRVIPVMTFKIWTLKTDPTAALDIQWGGAPDLPSAMAIACCVWQGLELYKPRSALNVVVQDGTGTTVAYLGQPR